MTAQQQTPIIPRPIVVSLDDMYAEVRPVTSDGRAELWWTDGISEWCETYEKASVAFARLATLVACRESGWTLGFTAEPDEFATQAGEFLARSVA